MMHLSYLVLLLIVILFWNWRFIGLDKVTGIGKPRRPCRWRMVAAARNDFPAHWSCSACGAEAGTRDGKEPTRCLGRVIH